MPEKRILLKNVDVPNIQDIDVYIEHGGYKALEKALSKMTPDQVIEDVDRSKLKGRGGAWFATGLKWNFMPKEPKVPSYLCVNADESEPGSFKDRVLMEGDPHLTIEGSIIASYAMRVSTCYYYIRGEMFNTIELIEKCIEEAYERGFLGKNILGTDYSLDMYVHLGAGAYICGEETGLMESLEGKRPYPRIKPPFPAQRGIFGCPTTVNNVMTLAYVPQIVNNGADWFRGIGAQETPGTSVFCVSGHVKRPGIYELEMGTPLRDIIYGYAGGTRDGHELKAVLPGGSSYPPLGPDDLDVEMTPESFSLGGGSVMSHIGTGAVIVMDETVCMVDALLNIMKFYAHESCGQCTPCREGAPWIRNIAERIEKGNGRMKDMDLIVDVAENVCGFMKLPFTTVCAFGAAFAWPSAGFVLKFKDEFHEHVKLGRCPFK